MKKKICLLLSLIGMLALPTTVKAVDFNVMPTTQCESYVDVTSLQLSGVTNKMIPVTMTLLSTDEHGKDYFFKMTIPETSMVNLCLRYESKPLWKSAFTIYSDATCSNVIYKSKEENSKELNNVVLYLNAGDYYVKCHANYDKTAVIATMPEKMIDKTTTTSTGASITIKVPNPAIYESKDPNVFYEINSTTKKELYTVNNILDAAVAYTPVDDMVKVKTKYINNVCTVTLDATKLYATTDQTGQCYIQMQNKKVAGQSTFDNPDVWDLNTDSSYMTTTDTMSTSSGITIIPYDSSNPTAITSVYLKKSGWYSFRISATKSDPTNFAVVKVMYIDVTSPTITGVKDGKVYYSDKTVKFADDSKGVGILKGTYNGKSFSSGKKFSSDGKYVIKVYDKNKNLKKLTFYIDKKKPVVTGVKNGATYKSAVTIKFSDAGTGVKSATLNGKSVKSGVKVKNSGTYTLSVKDKIGRVTTVKFTIRK